MQARALPGLYRVEHMLTVVVEASLALSTSRLSGAQNHWQSSHRWEQDSFHCPHPPRRYHFQGIRRKTQPLDHAVSPGECLVFPSDNLQYLRHTRVSQSTTTNPDLHPKKKDKEAVM